MRLKLRLDICQGACVSDASGTYPPVLATADHPVIELSDDHAQFVMDSAHGYVFEVDDSPDAARELDPARKRK